jgi:hypothetical protein
MPAENRSDHSTDRRSDHGAGEALILTATVALDRGTESASGEHAEEAQANRRLRFLGPTVRARHLRRLERLGIRGSDRPYLLNRSANTARCRNDGISIHTTRDQSGERNQDRKDGELSHLLTSRDGMRRRKTERLKNQMSIVSFRPIRPSPET